MYVYHCSSAVTPGGALWAPGGALWAPSSALYMFVIRTIIVLSQGTNLNAFVRSNVQG